MITNYRKAWVEYRKSQDFKDCDEILKAKGIKAFLEEIFYYLLLLPDGTQQGRKLKLLKNNSNGKKFYYHL